MDVVRVLVVEDHEPFRRALTDMLAETPGFVVVGAVPSAEGSLAAVAALRPALVLMDVNLPGISGIEATRIIRARPGAPVVVLMSTYAEDEVDWRSSGAAGFAAKGELGPGLLLELWDEAGRGGVTLSPGAGRRSPRGRPGPPPPGG